jgi:hypothetical protein
MQRRIICAPLRFLFSGFPAATLLQDKKTN